MRGCAFCFLFSVRAVRTEKTQFLQEIAAGVRQPWEFRVRFLGETKEQAKAVCGISDTVGTDSLSDRLPV